MKIVIIEDEEILANVLKEKFEREEFEVAIAKNGEEALPVVRKTNPDIILLDLILPRKNGLDVLRELKSYAEYKIIPVIVLSNLGEDETIKEALHLGAEDYFVKAQHPVNEVVEKVKERLLSKSK